MYEAAAVHKDLVEKQEQHKAMSNVQQQLSKGRGTASPDTERLGMLCGSQLIQQLIYEFL